MRFNRWLSAIRTGGAALGLLLSACGISRADAPDIWNVGQRFHSQFVSRQFGDIERYYADLKKLKTRSAKGSYLNYYYVNFTNVTSCFQFVAQGKAADGWTAQRCEHFYGELLNAWQKEFPQSELPCIGRTVLLLAKVEWARPDAQERQEFLALAWKSLQSAPTTGRGVSWYTEAFNLAVLEGWTEKRVDKLFKEAVAKFPDDENLYRAAARYHLPQYGGLLTNLDSLARFAAEQTSEPDKLVMYVAVYDQLIAASHPYLSWAYSYSRISWPLMREGLEQIWKRYPVEWNRNRLLQHACLAGDMETVRRVFPAVGPGAALDHDSGWIYREEEPRCYELAHRRSKELKPLPPGVPS